MVIAEVARFANAPRIQLPIRVLAILGHLVAPLRVVAILAHAAGVVVLI